MKIFIITMEDPLFTIPFLKRVILAKKDNICGLALVKKGNRLTVRKHQSKFEYIITLLIILGPFYFIKNSLKTYNYKIKIRLSKYFKSINSPDIVHFANQLNVPTFIIQNANNAEFLSKLKRMNPDIIINQSQNILRKELLSIPKVGIINRHNALLPRNRGRLTPFWVKYKKEEETGVSIHFVNEKVDAGAIIHQEKFKVKKTDSIENIVNKNYEVAFHAMIKAIDKLEKGSNDFIENDDSKATYNSIPSIKDAINYRFGKTFNNL